MTDEKKMQQAQLVYNTFCSMLDSKGWKYQRHDEELVIICGARGNDLPMQLMVIVNPRAQIVSILSPLPFKVPQEKINDMTVAVCHANYGFINGGFDLNVSDGKLRFRLATSFYDAVLGEGLLEYMIMVSCKTTDDYNDKFFAIAHGDLSVQQFIEDDIARRNGK
ncbi:MAG: hypothetical protein IKY44_04225 [Clostridia bacterium]|nr:hypothetical protein [Clostridia bacterium]